jgi:NAD+ synthase
MQTKRIIHHIVDWLNAYCDGTGLNGFVVGVSGGIDSAVTSTLCAISGRRTMLLNMPIRQDPAQVSLARRHIGRLADDHEAVSGVDVDLTPVLDAVADAFPTDIQDGLTMANTRSRLRMVALYAFASHHRMLVVGTGNKVEDFGVGFYTKYGDGGVDISPIADLMKSEVYALGRELGVMEEILTAPPTDGLWQDNRSDENQIGATYDELEWAMAFEATPGDEGQLTARQREALAIYRQFHARNRHKMDPIPVCVIPPEMRGE